jgi:hypothetical protein
MIRSGGKICPDEIYIEWSSVEWGCVRAERGTGPRVQLESFEGRVQVTRIFAYRRKDRIARICSSPQKRDGYRSSNLDSTLTTRLGVLVSQ